MNVSVAATTDQTIALLVAIAAFGLWAQKTTVGRTLSAPVCIMLAAALLANVGVLPHESAVYDGIAAYLVPAAVALFMLKADLVRTARQSGKTLVAFAVGAATSLIGVGVAVTLFALGADEAAVAGITAANLIGGTVNVIAVANVIGYEDPTRFAAVVSAGAASAVIYLAIVGLLANTPAVQRHFAPAVPNGRSDKVPAPESTAPESALGLVVPLLIASTIVAASKSAAASLGVPQFSLVVVTVLALAVANVLPEPMARVRGEEALGTIAMFAFFATIGAEVHLRELLGDAWLIGCFMLVATMVHLVLLLPLAAALRLDLGETLVGSVAGIAGPTTAAAFAAGRGWHVLVTPAVLTGVLGFGIGTLVGLAVFGVVRMT